MYLVAIPAVDRLGFLFLSEMTFYLSILTKPQLIGDLGILVAENAVSFLVILLYFSVPTN